MDFNALQHKLFAMDPVDPAEDIAKMKAQAAAPAAESSSIDYINESATVPEGSLQMDRDYSVTDFAALAGVVSESKQRPADKVRGKEPMPATSKPSSTGEQPHPLKDRLVGEQQIDELDIVQRGTASNANVEQTLASIQGQLQTLSRTIQQLQTSVKQMSQQTNKPNNQQTPIGLGDLPGQMQLDSIQNKAQPKERGIGEENKGLYHNVNARKKAGTSRSKNHPKAPSKKDWDNAAKTAQKESNNDSIKDKLYAALNKKMGV